MTEISVFVLQLTEVADVVLKDFFALSAKYYCRTWSVNSGSLQLVNHSLRNHMEKNTTDNPVILW